MQNRRNFLKQASLMLAGGLVAPQLLSSCGGKSGQAAATASESSKYIGLQLYSLRDLVKEEGIQKVLETAAKMGYKNLETASYDNGKIYGLAPAEPRYEVYERSPWTGIYERKRSRGYELVGSSD